MKAYVLLKVESGKDKEVFQEIEALSSQSGVEEIASLYGPFDMIVEVQFEDPSRLQQVIGRIRSTQGVAQSQTCTVARSWKPKS